MKNMLFLVALLINLSSVCKAQVGTEDIFYIESTGAIVKNYSMIDEFYKGVDISRLQYTPSYPFQFSVGSTTYTLKTCIFKDWDDNSSNGFNVISIYKDGRREFELKQPDIWTYTYGGGSSIDFKKYTDNEYFIPVKLSHKAMALVFLGWPYGGDMPYLTIIVATENDVNIVFNKRMGLNSITAYPFFKMKVQTILEEYDSNGKLCTPPMYAEIGLDGRDVLYLKK